MTWGLPRNYGMPALYDDVDFAEQALARLAATLAAAGDLDADVVDGRVEQGHPAAVLVGASDQARLLVLGSLATADSPRRCSDGESTLHPARPLPGRRGQGHVRELNATNR